MDKFWPLLGVFATDEDRLQVSHVFDSVKKIQCFEKPIQRSVHETSDTSIHCDGGIPRRGKHDQLNMIFNLLGAWVAKLCRVNVT